MATGMEPQVISALIGAGSQGLSMLGGQGLSNRQYHRQKKLMGFQKDHQKDLNVHGKQLAMDMWNQTNYGAQVDHMKDAGLNPALMYGSAGQGGSTNAGSGGSAQSGQAPQERVMDMQNMLLGAELALKKAQKDNIDKDTEDKESIIKERDGVKREETVSRTEMNNINNELNRLDLKWLKDRNLSRQSYGPIKAIKEASGESYERVFKAIDKRVGEIMDVAEDPVGAIKDRAKIIKDVIEDGVENTKELFKEAYDKWKNRKRD